MNLIGSLVDSIRNNSDLYCMMEEMLKYHIMPELNSSEAYLRYRAIWFYGEFESMTFTD